MEMRILENGQDKQSIQKISPDMISRARNYPLANLIESKKNMALCPFHEEKAPSFYIKNNYYYCFSCGVQGDVIDFVMKQKKLDFVSAVKFLV